jgi:ABC-type multidrug transport system fused ATPase/permease subunit
MQEPFLYSKSIGENIRLGRESAAELGMTAGAVKVAIHRLRQKFGDAIRREISETVGSEQEIQEELRYLIEVFQSR